MGLLQWLPTRLSASTLALASHFFRGASMIFQKPKLYEVTPCLKASNCFSLTYEENPNSFKSSKRYQASTALPAGPCPSLQPHTWPLSLLSALGPLHHWLLQPECFPLQCKWRVPLVIQTQAFSQRLPLDPQSGIPAWHFPPHSLFWFSHNCFQCLISAPHFKTFICFFAASLLKWKILSLTAKFQVPQTVLKKYARWMKQSFKTACALCTFWLTALFPVVKRKEEEELWHKCKVWLQN